MFEVALNKRGESFTSSQLLNITTVSNENSIIKSLFISIICFEFLFAKVLFFSHSRSDVAIILFRLAQLDINRAVGTSRSRYRACRRHRYHRYGVREDLLLIQVVFTKKGADEAKRNRR